MKGLQALATTVAGKTRLRLMLWLALHMTATWDARLKGSVNLNFLAEISESEDTCETFG